MSEEVEEHDIYDKWVRSWHWVNAMLFLVLAATGFRIHFGGREDPLLSFETAFHTHNLVGMLLAASTGIVGATVVSLGTTSPETAVSVMAAWSGEPGLALGNAIGSVIADSGLIFGLGCLLTVLPADRFVLGVDGEVDALEEFKKSWEAVNG